MWWAHEIYSINVFFDFLCFSESLTFVQSSLVFLSINSVIEILYYVAESSIRPCFIVSLCNGIQFLGPRTASPTHSCCIFLFLTGQRTLST